MSTIVQVHVPRLAAASISSAFNSGTISRSASNSSEVDTPAPDATGTGTTTTKTSSCARLHLVIAIPVDNEGVFWRGIYPLLFEAPNRVSRFAAYQLMRAYLHRYPALLDAEYRRQQHTTTTTSTSVENDGRPILHKRSLALGRNMLVDDDPTATVIQLIILPPSTTRAQRMFTGLLIRYEHVWLKMQSLSAWFATLGGGYFLCRHLTTALFLAKQQRSLAIWMGNDEMRDQCTLNEAFNYIHAGMFDIAKIKIRTVQSSARQRQDIVSLRMVKAARVFMKRVKRACKFEVLNRKDDPFDEYQRIRIVQDRSSAQRQP